MILADPVSHKNLFLGTLFRMCARDVLVDFNKILYAQIIYIYVVRSTLRQVTCGRQTA